MYEPEPAEPDKFKAEGVNPTIPLVGLYLKRPTQSTHGSAAITSRNDYFLRWRIRARIRRFFRPIFRRPRPVFFTPTEPPLTTSNHWIEIQKILFPALPLSDRVE